MVQFILNDRDIQTDLPAGMTVLDFVRYRENLKGTKIGCREGDCGACTILVGELNGESVRYRSMTSCLMPLANAAEKHIVTIEGINPADGSLTPVQQAMVDESGTQCGFCTVGFVMSLTNFCVDRVNKPLLNRGLVEDAISYVDGNICRCTGYKSIERAAGRLCSQLVNGGSQLTPNSFDGISGRLVTLRDETSQAETRALLSVPGPFVGGGTDVYVQKPEIMAETESRSLFYDDDLRVIRDLGDAIEVGASVTVTDLLESPVMRSVFPDLYKHLKLVSSTPIRNMATLAGNFVNASPIGDMTVWFLALDAEIQLSSPPYEGGFDAASADGVVLPRTLKLRDFYLGYKKLAKQSDEIITVIRYRKPGADFYFNFEKVCKRTYLDIATVNTAISLRVESTPGPGWTPPAVSSPPDEGGVAAASADGVVLFEVEHTIVEAHVSAGGVAPIPLYLKETSAFLNGKPITAETIAAANEIMQQEISPISDVRGTEQYKRLLLRQLFRAHFVELFATETTEL
jgi:xanthine dehydrogenase small subunit